MGFVITFHVVGMIGSVHLVLRRWTTMVSVAVVGVGDMGSEMIPHLLSARLDVTAYDVNRGRLEAAVD
jgi:NAD binding domain of 6-phosphogluconate dehydrogenase